MKVIKGIPTNVTKAVIGRITKEPLWRFQRKDFILATNDLNVTFDGYTAIITGNNLTESSSWKKNK